MNKILGLDLGTNSIGWAIRDISENENQIIDKGVLTFEKGVGEGKSGEFPLVQKRTESRSKRRNYQAEKYRKWALLQVLVENKMCPLSLEELDGWRKYTKGVGRKYPQSEKFIQWIRFDFDGNGKPDFESLGFSKHENHYLFRLLAVSEDEKNKSIFKDNPHILGRVLYHLVQRRGFRGRDDDEAKTIMQGSKENGTTGVDAVTPYIKEYKTLGAALYHLQKKTKQRIRKRYNLRSDYEQELKEICRVQNIDDSLYKRLWQAIIWQRPLRSQKGLVGVCTFEKNKSRCPVSHPLYEEFRAWSFINDLNIQLPQDIDKVNYLRERIYPLFYNVARDFKLTSISKELRKVNGMITSKFYPETKVISCTLLAHFSKLLGVDWKEKYGWHEFMQNEAKKCEYSIEDIWHILFTFDDKEKLKLFAKEKLGLSEDESEKFSKIKLQTGYATLSVSAIKKILPYLQQGFIYSHAVNLANLHKVLGKKRLTLDDAKAFSIVLQDIIAQNKNETLLITCVNNLISERLNSGYRYGMEDTYQLDDDDRSDILEKLKETFGEKTWIEKKTEEQRKYDLRFVSERYLTFLRKPITSKKEGLFIRAGNLHDKIFSYFQDIYDIPEERKKYLWHPTEQETYQPAKEKNGVLQLGNPQPISRGFKNPMALKTLHKLRALVNYLLQSGKIDEDTRVVIEIARELNDANKRKAIEKWQRDREKENYEFKSRIQEIAEKYEIAIDIENKSILDKYRLWVEQNRMCLYTGAIINLSELFNGLKYDFEHTIPASLSFDNELKNLTIADSFYNRQIKGKKIPTQLPNYDKEVTIDGREYTPILPRLEFMEKKVEELIVLFGEWKNKAKYASTKKIKDACIQRRHLIKIELDYWQKKLDTFKIKEFKAGWRNSQLRDTQIVTKYALPYLKTVFRKVEVEKGTVTAAFREIYEIQPKQERKDRNKYSHHAIDAAVLTLIPPASIRDKILERYNELKDQQQKAIYHEPVKDWKKFHPQYILSIDDDVLINFQPRLRTVTQTSKNLRKRGKLQFVREKSDNGKLQYKLDEKGNRIMLKTKGDTIRGQLHKESFFGSIMIDGKKWLVERYPISLFTSINDCKHIIDSKVRSIVKETLEKRMADGVTFDEAKLEPIPFPSGKEIIRKVRCKVAAGRGYLTPEKAIEVSRHTFLSKHEYKQFTYAQNEENALCLFYESQDGGSENAFRIVGLFDLAKLKLRNLQDISKEKYYSSFEIGKGNNIKQLPLSHIITVGLKVIFFREQKEELKELSQRELFKRVFRVYKFNEPAPATVYIYLQNHIEARSNDELGNGDKQIDFGKYQARIFLTSSKFKCAIEGRDFHVSPDGEIKWQF